MFDSERPTATASVDNEVDAKPPAELDAEPNVNPNWPPPYLLHFAGYGFDRVLSEARVTQKLVFAQTVRDEVLRATREPGGEAERA